ncbi:MAG: methyltransferase [Pseudolabrys sp.]|nr:methyltransferase [Pseudolabrys sp.]MBV9260673.1 methyltransferase [Pseudolabrys sp.]
MAPDSDVTQDAVLGGRLQLRQLKRGHRVGHDAILLAAATPLEPGEHAVDLGAGVGGAGLALAIRNSAAHVSLVEIDPTLCTLARDNVVLNGLDRRVDVIQQEAAACSLSEVDRVLMNPPFNDPARAQSSPDPGRRLAHVARKDTLAVWVGAASRMLKSGGTLSMVWRADGLAEIEAELGAGFGDLRILPIKPREDVIPIRVLVRARKDAAPERMLLNSLILNGPDGRPSPAAEAILREGDTLPLADS